MTKINKLHITLISSILFLANSSLAGLYIGGDFSAPGFRRPPMWDGKGHIDHPSRYDHKNTSSGDITHIFHPSKSPSYSLRLGYKFSPVFRMEFMTSYQPEHRFKYRLLPKTLESNSKTVDLDEKQGTADMSSNLFGLNFMYSIPLFSENSKISLSPYALFGLGISEVSIQEASASGDFRNWDLSKKHEFFKIHKNDMNCFTGQFGGGITTHLSDNFHLDLRVNFRTIYGIDAKYQEIDETTKNLSEIKTYRARSFSQEVTIGFIYDF